MIVFAWLYKTEYALERIFAGVLICTKSHCVAPN